MLFSSRRAIFQSTLPAGGATWAEEHLSGEEYISIHAPRGGSDRGCWGAPSPTFTISIHAPRGGSDIQLRFHFFVYLISIHAPRGGSDFF